MVSFKESISAEELDKLELASFPGKKILGFDTETRPCFSPDQPRYGVALLQLSGPERAYLFRIKSLGMHRRLRNLLSNDKIIKVGAAVNDDIRGLQRYAEFTPNAFVDLQKIVPDFGIRDKSVKKMTAIILGFKISKSQQLSNWEADTLSEAQTKYAATDAWVCREMYLRLMQSKEQ